MLNKIKEVVLQDTAQLILKPMKGISLKDFLSLDHQQVKVYANIFQGGSQIPILASWKT